MKNKYDMIKELIDTEGGYSNHKNDLGGETKYGITLKFLRQLDKYNNTNISDLTKNEASSIYNIYYFEKNSLDDVLAVNKIVCFKMFDIAVNMGFSKAVLFLQKAISLLQAEDCIIIDSKLGNKTIQALQDVLSKDSRNLSRILKMLKAQKCSRYMDICEKRDKNKAFIKGWLDNRVT